MNASASIKLVGYPVSNYVNVVRAALIEKELPYTLELRGGGREDDFLSASPMGKIPVLNVNGFRLTETVAILEYLDDLFPERQLRPRGVEERARTRQFINVVQMYVEAPARRLFPGVFMGGVNEPGAEAQVRTVLDVSTAALERITRPAPFLFGDEPGAADLFAFYNLDVVDRLGMHVWGRSMLAEAGLSEWSETMRGLAGTKLVLADFERFFAKYLDDKGAAYRPRLEQEA